VLLVVSFHTPALVGLRLVVLSFLGRGLRGSGRLVVLVFGELDAPQLLTFGACGLMGPAVGLVQVYALDLRL
jgi:hypothetical protein